MVIDDLLNRLDEEETVGLETYVYAVSNLSADDLAAAVNGWLESRNAIFTADPTSNNALTGAAAIVVVQPEGVQNQLLICCRPEYRDEVFRLSKH